MLVLGEVLAFAILGQTQNREVSTLGLRGRQVP
jgi:hypothetical protein